MALMPLSAELVAQIGARLAAAERLLASAAVVGDADDHRLWRSTRDLWARATAGDLTEGLGENVARSFSRAVMAPPGEGSVAEDLPVELEAVRRGMAVLIGVRSQKV